MLRRLGLALLGLGALVVAWAVVTTFWGDPITSLYTSHEQAGLAQRLRALDRDWAGRATRVAAAGERARLLRLAADRFGARARDGQPIGRIVIPRLGLSMVVVQGTTESDLEKGPGHYDRVSGRATGLPGMGRIVAIAGHRTTYLHPFLHIDSLVGGDRIHLVMPYGRFVYAVTGHRVVAADDWSILRPRPVETLVLTACNPLYSAAQRWVVFARLVAETPA